MRPLRSHLCTLVLAGLALLVAGCLGEDGDRPTKLEALARWEDRRLAPQDSLATFLQDPDAHVRLAAVRSAGLIGRNDALVRMLDLLDDPSQTVRIQTCFSLGILGDSLAVPALEKATEDARPTVRLAALRGLAQVPNDGSALLKAAVAEEPREAAAAFDALRNQADRVPREDLLKVLRAGLVSDIPDIQWRTLRCVERAPDSTLVHLVIPYARSNDEQVRIHAFRALSRLGGTGAKEADLTKVTEHPFRGRAEVRLDVAACRALGALSALAPEEMMPAFSAVLIEMAGHRHPHVSASALEAMAQVVADHPLPPEAADRESLLPVWRIRMARSAAERLDHPEAGVRAAAIRARAALRGRGALDEFTARLDHETVAFPAAALAKAIGDLAENPQVALRPILGRLMIDSGADRGPARRWYGHATVVGEALTAIAARDDLSQQLKSIYLFEFLMRARRGGATDHDQVLAAVALDLLGAFPGDGPARSAVRTARLAPAAWHGDLNLGALGCLTRIWAATDSIWTPTDSTAALARIFINEGLDDPDIRIRLAARRFAEESKLLSDDLIPTEASLHATLPAFVRSTDQPGVALSFHTPLVTGTTSRGDFTITLRPDLAPNTCAMFLDLIDKGFYEDLIFHRVVPDFVVQGGDPTGTGWGGPGYTIRSEWSATPYTRGMVGIAHSGKDTGGSQWFVTLSEQPHLVGRYTIFGKVTKGLEVFDDMQPGDLFSLSTRP